MDILVKQKLETELNAEILWIDSVFGNNEEVALNIELKGNNRIFPNDYTGELEITVKRNYLELGSEVSVQISNTNPLTIDDDKGESYSLRGSIEIQRTLTTRLKLIYKGYRLYLNLIPTNGKGCLRTTGFQVKIYPVSSMISFM